MRIKAIEEEGAWTTISNGDWIADADSLDDLIPQLEPYSVAHGFVGLEYNDPQVFITRHTDGFIAWEGDESFAESTTLGELHIIIKQYGYDGWVMKMWNRPLFPKHASRVR